jgi:hypothetical protein
LAESGIKVVAFSRVVAEVAEPHSTYSLLAEVADMGRYKELTENLLPQLLTVIEPLFGDKVMWFTSLMKTID